MNLVTPQVEVFYDQVLERVRALPGVERAGIISRLPMNVWTFPFTIVGPPGARARQASRRPTSTRWTRRRSTRSGSALLRGRGIEERDVASAPWVAVVNKTFADRHFPGQDPIGQGDPPVDGRPRARRRSTIEEPQPREIVGVVADVTYPSFFTREARRRLHPVPAARLAVRARGRVDPHAQGDGGADHRRSADAGARRRGRGGPGRPRPGGARLHDDGAARAGSPSVTNSRFFASLFTIFGTLAILLAMVGVYGVMSWVVGQRTSEFGIRMALGAARARRGPMLLGQSLRPILLGLALGSLGGFGLSRALNAMFWRMTERGPRGLRRDRVADAGRRARGGVGPGRTA